MIDDEHDYEHHGDDLDCDCAEEEVDVLEGIARCWQCGSTRPLSSEELKSSLEIEAKFQEEYYLHLEESAAQEEANRTYMAC